MKERFDLPPLLELVREKALAQPDHQVRFLDVGTLLQVGSGVAGLSGLPWAMTDELVDFPTGVQGLILNLERRRIDCILLGPDEGLQGGDLVTSSGRRLRVPVGAELMGRVVDPLGRPLDGKALVVVADWHHLEREAPNVVERSPVSRPLHTGLKAIDALVPIGRGQRELIIGDRQTGKTAIAVDTVINQRAGDVVCVYVSIGQKKSSARAVIQALESHGALAHTIVVVADPDAPPALRYLAPYAGCTMAEYFVYHGRDVLIVYDDLSKHADTYRELSLLLRRPPGREAYPGDIFYLHARLLERAGQFDEALGGGSLTALPIVETKRGQIATYIPTNLISITDGQIYLDSGRFNRGFRPAIDVGLSVSRVGGAAQRPAMRAVAGRLRLELAQYEEVARFTRFGGEVDERTRRQITRGEHLAEVLKQEQNAPLSLAQQVVILYAASQGYLDDLPLDEVARFESTLRELVPRHYPALYRHLADGDKLTPEMEAELEQAIAAARATFAQGS
ncbi:MAG: F0F1 ATP synthase subunit alpha [Chloroflexi bacterium]|nr:F0F1 ATP synthase subunit alpha [Chloroflexota bacterium]